ncbi:uncharacterized protein LOC108600667 [Drosophila busckii]|uniref:uncharacterized protein LOC108600667 n=1 Tax=Drosophila busckii TaxID=30019 RepID=UPI001432AA77|nr:uncharacterized protein LOC108600667 [Drosophila busckii]
MLAKSEANIISACNVASIESISCKYKRVERRNDAENSYSNASVFRLQPNVAAYAVASGALILRLKCFGRHEALIYHDVHFFLPAPAPAANQTHGKRLSVMILGLDSMSHMHYLRMLPQTASYVQQLPHVEFWGYNRVGRNSYPNLVPLLSGLSEQQLARNCENFNASYDDCNFIWKQFKAAGYNTTYAEDSRGSTFNYAKPGFKQPPADFYLRPVMVEIDKHTRSSVDKEALIHCSWDRSYGAVLREFLYRLLPHLAAGPHFSFFWEVQGVHDYFNFAPLLDAHYTRLLQQLQAAGVLEHTLVLFMADHGIRLGAFRNTGQGMLEENQPMLIALYPRWLAEAYPLALAQLHANAHSLVTTYDLHATMLDLLDLQQLEQTQIQVRTAALSNARGISLFLPIPDERDCHSAGIPSQFCLCHKLSSISTNDERAQRAARFVVKSINNILEDYTLCHRLSLHELQAAYLYDLSLDIDQFEIKVRLRTWPGLGGFEGTTRFTHNSLTLIGAIIRTNRYGNQSYCVHNYRIEMYCYCLYQ